MNDEFNSNRTFTHIYDILTPTIRIDYTPYDTKWQCTAMNLPATFWYLRYGQTGIYRVRFRSLEMLRSDKKKNILMLKDFSCCIESIFNDFQFTDVFYFKTTI